MESCRLPIELCEKVMNALRGYEDEILDGTNSRMQEEYTSKRQPALRACALTCHAWRVRAQYLLWTFPVILDSQHLAHFRTAIRSSPNITITRGLVLGGIYGPNELDLSTAGELFMRSFPHLQRLLCFYIRFDRGPPLRVLRMRLPFFASITALRLYRCTFQSLRAMLGVVWACRNLATLDTNDVWFKSECSGAGLRRMHVAVGHFRACQKLTALRLDGPSLEAGPSFLPHASTLLTTCCDTESLGLC